MPKEKIISNLKDNVAAIDELLKGYKKDYNSCKRNIDYMKTDHFKALFSKKVLEIAMIKCNLLIDLFEKKVVFYNSMHVFEQCTKSKVLYKCSIQLSNFQKNAIEMYDLIQRIDSVNEQIDELSVQEDLAESANLLKPLCHILSPNDPNYESAMEVCGKWSEDPSL